MKEGVNAEDAQAMFELQLELHALVIGATPPITADELLDVHELLTNPARDLTGILDLGRGG